MDILHLSGATFNDTTKTITVSGTTALSGLTTDVLVSSISNGDVLRYSTSSGKWINNNTLSAIEPLVTNLQLFTSVTKTQTVHQNTTITTTYVDVTDIAYIKYCI